MTVEPSGYENAFEVLRQFSRRKRSGERCELCSADVGSVHQHLIEPANQKLVCVCEACAILFSNTGLKYKRVPLDVLWLADFHLTDGVWESLMIPINMAFFFRSTPQEKVMAFYPSPAGAVESLLPLETWNEIEHDNPVLKEMQPDVQALLVNRVGHSRGFAAPDYCILPIDECYKLVGLIRTHWRGLSGGAEVWQEIATFIAGLKQRATLVRQEANA